MFTGIVEDMGTVASLSPLRAGTAITVATNLPMDTIAEGDSVAVSGVCLTVTRKGAGTFTADARAIAAKCVGSAEAHSSGRPRCP